MFPPVGQEPSIPPIPPGFGGVPALAGGAAIGERPVSRARRPGAPYLGSTKKIDLKNDQSVMKYFDRCKREAFADRWIFERQFTRDIHYLNLRQWLAPYSRTEGWRDARIAKGVPKPCTSKPKEIDQSIRSMFQSIRFGVIVRPQNQGFTSVQAAQTADDLAPLIHDLHDMDTVMNEFDYSFVNLGNGFLHTYFDESAQYGVVDLWFETCRACQETYRADLIANNRQKCPGCQQRAGFDVAYDQAGEPIVEQRPMGCAQTVALSPLELAFPLQRARWADVPFVIRMRWRTKSECESIPSFDPYLEKIQWARGPAERSLQIFQALALQNDIPASRTMSIGAATNSSEEEGVAEYELWTRPSPEFPDGLVIRVLQDNDPILFHDEDGQGLPGPLPYTDEKGNPLFTFTHAGYHHVGGRVIASGVHEPVIQKYDQLNRIDSLIEMIAMRVASPQWMLPKGAQVEWLGNSPGVPGLILQWNSQIAGEAGRPQLQPGIPPDAALMSYRKGIIEDIEEATGTYDILRGTKPSGVEAFSAMQLLVESGQRRFTSAFQARGNAYKDWYGFAIEIERQFGPDQRTMALLSPSRGYTFKTFKKANLKSDVVIVIEDGTYTPKTALGRRAAIEHLNQLGFLKKDDPDTQYNVFQEFGQTRLVPALDAHVQSAHKKQEDFEEWVTKGGADQLEATPLEPNVTIGQIAERDPKYPLRWLPWYDARVHRSEFLKWANSSAMQRMMLNKPIIEGLLRSHLSTIDLAIMQAGMGQLDPDGQPAPPQPPAAPGAPGAQPSQGGGAGAAMANSNQNAGAGQPPISGQMPTAPVATAVQ